MRLPQEQRKEIWPSLTSVSLTLSLRRDKIIGMLNYAICEISGKQYKIIPGKELEIDFQGDSTDDIEVNVLLLSEGDKLKIGSPYLKEKLVLKRVNNIKGQKVRVGKFHAKANFRKIIGFRSKLTKIVLLVKK